MATTNRNSSDAASEFRTAAESALRRFAQRGEGFTTDEVWEEIGQPEKWGLTRRALAPIVRGAVIAGVIADSGTTRNSARRECHGRPLPVWVPGDGTQHLPARRAKPATRPKVSRSFQPSVSNPKWLWKRYVEDGMPVSVLMAESGSTQEAVLEAMLQSDITPRRGAEDILTTPVLADLFVSRGLDAFEVGQATQTGAGSVEVMLSRFGIPLEARGAGDREASRIVSEWRKSLPKPKRLVSVE